MAAPTSTNSAPLSYPIGGKLVWCSGYWIVFYYDGTNIKYAYTSDADITEATFSAAQSSGITQLAKEFQVISDGNAIHVAYCTSDSTPIYYRRGTVSGGVVTFGAAQTAVTGTQMRVTSIAIGADNHVLIGFYADNKAKVTRNANDISSATWAGDTDFPVAGGMTVSDSTPVNEDSILMYVKVVPLTGSAFFVVYAGVTGGHVFGKKWDGSTLGSREQCTDVICSATGRWDARGYQDEVWIVWNSQPTNYRERVRRRDSSGTWGTASPYVLDIQSGCDYDNIPAISIDDTTGDVYVFWMDYPTDAHVYYAKFTRLTASWGSVVDWVTSSATPDDGQLVATANNLGDRVGLAWVTGSSTYTIHTASILAPGGAAYGPSGGVVLFDGLAII